MHLKVDEKNIIWPGRQTTKPEGFMIPTHLKVLTIEEKPFVYVRKLQDINDNCTLEEIPCPHFNATNESKLHSFSTKHLKTIYLFSGRKLLLQRLLHGLAEGTVC